MDHEQVISNLRRKLLIERIAFAVIVMAAIGGLIMCKFTGDKSVIMVDGKPVVCVPSHEEAKRLLDTVKQDTGCDPEEIKFQQKVVVARAPRDARPVSRGKAIRLLKQNVCPLVVRWAIIVDGKPVVALPSREEAGTTLEQAKLKFGKMVENLAEEPQFKENVTVDIAAVRTSICKSTAKEAVEFIFSKRESISQDAVYTVRNGDVAAVIADRIGIPLEKLWEMNPGINLHKLQIGDKIKIKATKTAKAPLTVVVRDLVERTEEFKAPAQSVSSARIYSGKSVELSAGRSGIRRVKVATIYENGQKTNSEIQEEEIIREAVPRRVAVGIRPALP